MFYVYVYKNRDNRDYSYSIVSMRFLLFYYFILFYFIIIFICKIFR